MILNQIRKECAWLSENNDHVTICYDLIPDYVEYILAGGIPPSGWDENWHYMGGDEETLAYIIALDSINFGSGYFSCLKKSEGITSGYATVAMALKDKFEDTPLTAHDLAVLTVKDCGVIFGQNTLKPEMQDLMSKFSAALNDTGQHILNNHNGKFSEFVREAGGSVAVLVEQLASISSFKDVSVYQGQEIPIYKRAQITAGDIYTAFQGEGIGKFNDIGQLTIFADNVVPHVLRYDGILSYSDDLVMRIDGGEELPPDDEAEIALRACSIHAVEKIIAEFSKQGHDHIIPLNIDHWLWNRGHDPCYMDKKRHVTKTTCY